MPRVLNSADITAATGSSPSLDKLLRQVHRAFDTNPYDLPDYGAGPSAGKAAPTLTWASSAPNTRTQYRSAADADNSFAQYYGGVPFANTATSVGFPVVSSTFASFGTSGRSGVAWGVETITDGSGISIRHQYNAAVQYRLWIDGQFVNRAPLPQTSANGGVQFLNVDFGSRCAKGRRVRYESELNSDFRGFYVEQTARLWKPTPADFVRAVWIADSYGGSGTEAGTPNSFAPDNYASFTMKLVGVHDGNNLCAAGTGLIRSVAQAQNYIGAARLSDIDFVQQKGPIDLVVIQGSINDNGNVAATITANALTLIQGARAKVGASVPIIVLGVCPGSTIASGQALSNEMALAAAVAQAADPLVAFVPITTATPSPVINGSGKDGTAVGDGNAELYIRSDGIHPTYGQLTAANSGNGGMEYLARIAASGIRNALVAMRR